MTTSKPDSDSDQPTSPHSSWVGWLSFGLAIAGIVLVCAGDPFWLALPCSAVAIWTGHFSIHHGQPQHAGAHLGFNLGLFNLLLWVMLILLMQYVLDMDPMWLFDLPTTE